MSFSSTVVTLIPPLLGLHIEDLADVLIDLVGLGQGLIQRVPPHDCAQRRLRYLVDGNFDVLDRHHRADGVRDAVVGDCRYVHADVVAGDDAL
jgi:hypothetical protein